MVGQTNFVNIKGGLKKENTIFVKFLQLGCLWKALYFLFKRLIFLLL